MKINYKNTALGLIDDPNNFSFGFPDPEITPLLSKPELLNFGYSIINSSDKLKQLCGDNIQYVSHSFMHAFLKGKHKLASVFDKENIEEGGIIITGGHSNGYTHWHTYYYYVNTYVKDTGEWDYQLLFIDFSKPAQNDSCNLDIYVSENDGLTKSLIYSPYLRDGRDILWWEAFIITFILFKKYVDCENKIVNAGKRERHNDEKYVNETNRNVTILDSRWFTTIVRSEGFGVRGHFRFQPCGEGLKDRKLIWIPDYEKMGYTSKAKILKDE